jgi:hypothetical protein
MARISGYVAKRCVDIGDHVKAEQLLAEISAPELDHQIAPGPSDARPQRGGAQPGESEAGDRECHLEPRQQSGRPGLDHESAGRHRTAEPAGAGGRGHGRASKHPCPASPARGAAAAEGLPARGGTVRRRRHPAQHRQRQPGAGRRRWRRTYVHADAQRRDPRPDLRAAGPSVRSAKRGRGDRARPRDAEHRVSGHRLARSQRAPARHANPAHRDRTCRTTRGFSPLAPIAR